VVSALQHVHRHAHLDPALQVLGRVGLGEEGGELHAHTAHELGAFVDFSVLPQGPVWLDRVAMASVRVDVWQFAARCDVSVCRQDVGRVGEKGGW
jgi:hypothetical protein